MTTPRSMILLTLFVGSFWVQNVEPHGRLIEPPSRSTMWRYVLKVEKSDSKKKSLTFYCKQRIQIVSSLKADLQYDISGDFAL